MKTTLLKICGLMVLGLALAGTFSAYAQQDITPEYKATIDQLLEISQSADMARAMVDQMQQNMVPQMKQSNPKIPPKFFDILIDEMNTVFEKEISEKHINEVAYPVYAKKFTQKEIEEVIAFYKTPTGKKISRESASLTREVMQSYNARVQQELMPMIMQNVQKRAEKEGIDFK